MTLWWTPACANRHLQLKDTCGCGGRSVCWLVVLCSSAQAQSRHRARVAQRHNPAGIHQCLGRNGFNRLVGAPTGNVTNYGTTGLIQQFPSVTNSNATLALIKPDTSRTSTFFRCRRRCSPTTAPSRWAPPAIPIGRHAQLPGAFAVNHHQLLPVAAIHQQLRSLRLRRAVADRRAELCRSRDPFFTKWTSLGGMQRTWARQLRRDTGHQPVQFGRDRTDLTIRAPSITSLPVRSAADCSRCRARLHALRCPTAQRAGSLGLPATEELLLPNGMLQQTFEGGAIEHDPIRPGSLYYGRPSQSYAIADWFDSLECRRHRSAQVMP